MELQELDTNVLLKMHDGLLSKAEKLESDQYKELAKPGEPLPPEFYRNYVEGSFWLQFHWRGMPKKGDPLDGHSVHADLRLKIDRWWQDGKERPKGEIPKERIEWVLAGTEDRINRGIKGLDDPATQKPQNLQAVVKESAAEYARRIEEKEPGLAKAILDGQVEEDWLIKALNDGTIVSNVAHLAKAIYPLRGYWIAPGNPGAGGLNTWAFLQLVDIGTFKSGVQRRDLHEYFFYGDILKGRYILRALSAEK
jgi:hypothetical protein